MIQSDADAYRPIAAADKSIHPVTLFDPRIIVMPANTINTIETPRDRCALEKLPSEVLQLIFSYLNFSQPVLARLLRCSKGLYQQVVGTLYHDLCITFDEDDAFAKSPKQWFTLKGGGERRTQHRLAFGQMLGRRNQGFSHVRSLEIVVTPRTGKRSCEVQSIADRLREILEVLPQDCLAAFHLHRLQTVESKEDIVHGTSREGFGVHLLPASILSTLCQRQRSLRRLTLEDIFDLKQVQEVQAREITTFISSIQDYTIRSICERRLARLTAAQWPLSPLLSESSDLKRLHVQGKRLSGGLCSAHMLEQRDKPSDGCLNSLESLSLADVCLTHGELSSKVDVSALTDLRLGPGLNDLSDFLDALTGQAQGMSLKSLAIMIGVGLDLSLEDDARELVQDTKAAVDFIYAISGLRRLKFVHRCLAGLPIGFITHHGNSLEVLQVEEEALDVAEPDASEPWTCEQLVVIATSCRRLHTLGVTSPATSYGVKSPYRLGPFQITALTWLLVSLLAM